MMKFQWTLGFYPFQAQIALKQFRTNLLSPFSVITVISDYTKRWYILLITVAKAFMLWTYVALWNN